MRLLLVDGHYYLYRSFFAIRGLKNSRGEPTNAIYGFFKAIRKMLADVKPDRAAVIWDCGLPARRTELQPDYKQNRTEMPDDLRPQEDWLQKNTPLLGVACLEIQNTEADDLIASYAVQARREGAEIVIATNDKDILQLVGDGISIYSTVKNDIKEGGFALLGTEAELESVLNALASPENRRLTTVALRHATLATLRRVLAEEAFDVFHFIFLADKKMIGPTLLIAEKCKVRTLI